jgi:hypothetical protein
LEAQGQPARPLSAHAGPGGDPSAEIEIRFERLGTLRCCSAEPARKLLPGRWPLRPALQKVHGL